MCKHSNVFSRPVLIARGLDFELHLPLCSFQVRVRVPARRFARPCDGARFSAVIAEGSHLFPFRTEKLSPPAPMVLQGQPCGRVGRRRIFVTHGPLSRSRLSGPCVVKPPAGHTRICLSTRRTSSTRRPWRSSRRSAWRTGRRQPRGRLCSIL